MLSKFSVKKPYTIFVAVVLIIVLGVVSFLNMTPNLMPNMEFPYVMVMTTYAGATPQEVEEQVTKPIEERLATVDNVRSVSSTSAENYSVVNLEFANDANMDTVVIDIREQLNLLSGQWNEYVGTPNIIKLNMDMLPVSVAAVNMEGVNTLELSEFVEKTLIGKLEGIEGVAAVSMSGIVNEEIIVTLDEARMDEMNEKIRAAIDEQFAESEQELADAREELQEGTDEIESGKSDIKSGKKEIEAQKKKLSQEMAKAKAELDTKQYELLELKMTLTDAMAGLNEKKTELQGAIAELEKAKAELEASKQQLTEAITAMETAKAGLAELNAAKQMMIDAAVAQGMTETDAETYLAENSVEYQTILAQIAAVEAQLSAFGVTLETLDDQLNTMKMNASELNAGLEEVEKNLAEAQGGMQTIDENLVSMQEQYSQLEEGLIGVEEGKKALYEQESQLSYSLYGALAQLTSGESMLELTEKQLEGSQDSIESAEEQISDAKEDAYDGADLHTILTESMISQILTAQNFSMPAGYAEDADGMQWMVGVGETIQTAEELKGLVLLDLGIDGLEPILLLDVADVVVDDNSDEIYAKLNGSDGVLLSFQKQSDAATAEASDNVQKKFEELSAQYPGLSFTMLLDQGQYIHIIIDSVLENLLIGAVLAILILLLFLRDLRPTGIVALSIPVSVVFAIVLMYFSGVTLNMISLSGLAVGVGMLVDNSIVAIENIYRLRRMGLSPYKAAISGASQVAGALVASTLTTVCVFVPIVFIEGITRQLFTDLALTVAYSLLASLIVALTVVPATASGILKRINIKENKGFDKFANGYKKTLDWALSHKAVCLIVSIVLLTGSVILALGKGFSYMPEMESTQIMISVLLPEENTLEDTVETCEEIVAEINGIEGVADVGSMLSGGLSSVIGISSGGADAVNNVTMYAVLEEGLDSGSNIEGKIQEILDGHPEAEASLMGASSMMSMTGSEAGIAIDLYGTELDTLERSANEIAEILENVDGIADVYNGIEETTPKLMITVDKNKAMEQGLTTAQVYAEISAKLSDTKLNTEINDTEVTVVADAELKLQDIREHVFTVTDREGEEKLIKLADIAEITETTSMATINRLEQRRYLQVTATLEEGENVTLVTADAQKALADYQAKGLAYEFKGENESIMDAMGELLLMLLLGIVIVYLIMVAQFQSLLSPFIVMFTIPLAFTGGLIALLICGMDLSIIAMVGMVMFVGIIVNNGIVLIDYINLLRKDGNERRAAVLEACHTRLRPVLMTAITTILGLVPMALALGTGATLTQPMAVTCIGGLIYATFMTLYIVPILYDSLCKKPPRVVTKEEMEISEL